MLFRPVAGHPGVSTVTQTGAAVGLGRSLVALNRHALWRPAVGPGLVMNITLPLCHKPQSPEPYRKYGAYAQSAQTAQGIS